ncbi:MAG: nucleotidyl transferase AbiEii/AbiGii toxin family protein [Candidatus Melainabacteria bacterium]|nr:nucleotidyl transferase AbiEii/AbiGii toxin family protein [Candidatus Melainabacteria bacterium]
MFKREHHIRVATILQTLNAELLINNGCCFGGGTAIVLSHDEYRESVDLDFLVSDRNGYQTLRHLMTGKEGIQAIARAGMELTPVREIRADQYGIRTLLQVAKTEIKFEIIFEARIQLESPSLENRICGVAPLSPLDMAASKLLANSDRWADDSVFSRDLIDLAMLEVPRPLLTRAIKKARGAYGESISRDLARSIQRLKERVGRLDECMTALKIDGVAKALLWKRIRRLNPSKGSPS